MTYDVVTLHSVKNDGETFQIHKQGCKEVDKLGRVQPSSNWCTTPEDCIGRELEGELGEIGYTEDDFRIMPCVR